LLKEYALQHQLRLLVWEDLENVTAQTTSVFPSIDLERRALILYTSGTTNKPKGVVTTHANIHSQITTLITAWQWSSNDSTICVLPLHHVHGIINVVCCSLWIGANCLFLPEFSAAAILDRFLAGELNVFMAVPTVYFKLIAHFDQLNQEDQAVFTAAMSRFRLMVCGSAALPVSIMEKWKAVSGQILLERYGMTELGMAISNPYVGERRAGYVGLPLPGVEVKLVDENFQTTTANEPGEILVKGSNVFKEYWNKPESTKETFTADGWFKTGDMAVVENGYYRILGRSSVDIIKSGGYKISALEIEETLREVVGIKDCAVVGIPNDEWGELIVAAIVQQDSDANFSTTQTEQYLLQKMAAYKKPRKYLIVDELPRNAMGKVVKNEVKKLFSENN
jgi:malonyl-CoA/methylmalonyl-CoA synthetase